MAASSNDELGVHLQGLTTWEKIARSPLKATVLTSLGWSEQQVITYAFSVTGVIPKSFDEAAATLTRKGIIPSIHPQTNVPMMVNPGMQMAMGVGQNSSSNGPGSGNIVQGVQMVSGSYNAQGTSSNRGRRPGRQAASGGPAVEKPVRMFQCQTCGLQFNRNSNLKVHQVVHTKEKPYSCSVCNRRFGLKGALTAHSKIHNEEKPYACNICGKKFRVNGNLLKHRRTHTKGITQTVQIACAEAVIDDLPEDEAQELLHELTKRLRAKKLGRRKKSEYPEVSQQAAPQIVGTEQYTQPPSAAAPPLVASSASA